MASCRRSCVAVWVGGRTAVACCEFARRVVTMTEDLQVQQRCKGIQLPACSNALLSSYIQSWMAFAEPWHFACQHWHVMQTVHKESTASQLTQYDRQTSYIRISNCYGLLQLSMGLNHTSRLDRVCRCKFGCSVDLIDSLYWYCFFFYS